jgi:hypothetical protein
MRENMALRLLNCESEKVRGMFVTTDIAACRLKKAFVNHSPARKQ